MSVRTGRLYAAENARKRIVAYAPDGKLPCSLPASHQRSRSQQQRRGFYFTESPTLRVWHIDTKGIKHLAFDGAKDQNLQLPNGCRLEPTSRCLSSPTRSWRNRVVVSHPSPMAGYRTDSPSTIWKSPTTVEERPLRSERTAYFDDQGHLVATKLGIVLRSGGARGRIIRQSQAHRARPISVFGGTRSQALYATAGDKVFKAAAAAPRASSPGSREAGRPQL